MLFFVYFATKTFVTFRNKVKTFSYFLIISKKLDLYNLNVYID